MSLLILCPHVMLCHSAFSSNSRNRDYDPQQTVTAERIVTLTRALQEHFYSTPLAAAHFQTIQFIIMESLNAFYLSFFAVISHMPQSIKLERA